MNQKATIFKRYTFSLNIISIPKPTAVLEVKYSNTHHPNPGHEHIFKKTN